MTTTYRVFLSDGSEDGRHGTYAWFVVADHGDGRVDGQYAVSETVEAADAADAIAQLPPAREWVRLAYRAGYTHADIAWREPTDEERWQAGDPPLHLIGEEVTP